MLCLLSLHSQTLESIIPELGKADYTLTNSFRPISLSNYLLKGLERLCCWKMEEALEQNPIHTRQHGFRCDRSTETAISTMTNYIEKHIFQRKHCVAAFLDISAAFDSIRPEFVRERLLDQGGDAAMVDWYIGYIVNRNLELDLCGQSRKMSTSMGFPQGGVCSALFWVIAFDPAIKIINENLTVGNGFADDCAIVIGGIKLKFMVKKLQATINKLTDWGARCGLSFNPSKTVIVHFTRRKKQPPEEIQVNGVPIPYSDTAKYLGVTLDKGLYWRQHIQDKLQKAKSLTLMTLNAVRNNFGPKPRLMKWAYTGVVRPMVSYAAMIWGHEIHTKKVRKLMDAIDRKALLSIAQVKPSTPTEGLRVIYDLLPLSLHIQYTGTASFLRQKHVLELDWEGRGKNKTFSIAHLLYWEEISQKLEIPQIETDKIRKRKWSKNFVLTSASLESRTDPSMEGHSFFTDGSLLNGRTGFGFVSYYNRAILKEHCGRLNDGCTVFQAEVWALSEVGRYIAENYGLYEGRSVTIYCDSKAALLAVNSHLISSKVVERAILNLNRAGDVVAGLELRWIKAHIGYAGNEKADELAKRAGSLPGEPCLIPLSSSLIKFKLKSYMYKQWENRWLSYGEARMTKEFYPNLCPSKANKVLSMCKFNITKYINAITGHNELAYHRSLIHPELSSTCGLCGQGRETFYHLITDCQALDSWVRTVFLDKPPISGEKWTVRNVMKFMDERRVEDLMFCNAGVRYDLDDAGSERSLRDSDQET